MNKLPQGTSKLDFDDILIEPNASSEVSSRFSDIELDEYYPIITAPMDTVVNEENVKLFEQNRINVCLPRGIDNINGEHVFTSVSLQEFEKIYVNGEVGIVDKSYVCIDVANGHMKKMHTAIQSAKKIYGKKLVIMAGNVASAAGFLELARAGADYVRCGVGFGGGCLTAQQVGVGAAMASLIDDCRQVINNSGDERSGIEPFNTKIVADGGMKKYSDIIKAIALGADYVMLGSVLNKALESCAVTTNEQGEVVDQYDPKAVEFVKNGGKLFKQFRGMSTKEVQKTWNKNEIKTSEGVVRNWPVEYTVGGWVENFNHYLRSAMSYSNSKTLDEFKRTAKFNVISENSLRRFTK